MKGYAEIYRFKGVLYVRGMAATPSGACTSSGPVFTVKEKSAFEIGLVALECMRKYGSGTPIPVTHGPKFERKSPLEVAAGVTLATFHKSADTVSVSISGRDVEATAYRKQGNRGVFLPAESVTADDDPENVGRAILKAFDWFDR